MHSVLQLLEKPEYAVPQEKAKTQPEVRMDLDVLFYLPAVLQGGFTRILIFVPISVLWCRECRVSWSALIQSYPPLEGAGLHTLNGPAHLGGLAVASSG